MNADPTEHELTDFDRRLVEFFDGELDAGERANFEARLELEPELDASVKEWGFVGDIVRSSLEAEAEALPQARFEQLWDQFDATLARESRLQEAAVAKPSLWSRLSALLAPVRVPLAVGAAAAIIGVVAWNAGGDGVASGPAVAETQAPAPAPKTAVPDAPAAEAPKLAVAPEPTEDAQPFPSPTSNEAEIERIEFGGRSGTISQIEGARGTTTVIWVQEDEEPVESERSL